MHAPERRCRGEARGPQLDLHAVVPETRAQVVLVQKRVVPVHRVDVVVHLRVVRRARVSVT